MSIKVSQLTKVYGEQKALNNINFEVKRPEVVGFLGPNGAGKSTMMKILTTYINASDGEASVNGFDVISAVHVANYLAEPRPHRPLYARTLDELYIDRIGVTEKLAGWTRLGHEIWLDEEPIVEPE